MGKTKEFHGIEAGFMDTDYRDRVVEAVTRHTASTASRPAGSTCSRWLGKTAR